MRQEIEKIIENTVYECKEHPSVIVEQITNLFPKWRKPDSIVEIGTILIGLFESRNICQILQEHMYDLSLKEKDPLIGWVYLGEFLKFMEVNK